MSDSLRLDGKVAIVTGAAGVIGRATMLRMAERGARLVAVDCAASELADATAALPSSAQALTVIADVTQEDEVARYVGAAVDRFGSIDVFYNNAGTEGDVAPITQYRLKGHGRSRRPGNPRNLRGTPGLRRALPHHHHPVCLAPSDRPSACP